MAQTDAMHLVVDLAQKVELNSMNKMGSYVDEAEKLRDLAKKCADLYKILSADLQSNPKKYDYSKNPEAKSLFDELREKKIIDGTGYSFDKRQIEDLTGKLSTEQSNIIRKAEAVLAKLGPEMNSYVAMMKSAFKMLDIDHEHKSSIIRNMGKVAG